MGFLGGLRKELPKLGRGGLGKGLGFPWEGLENDRREKGRKQARRASIGLSWEGGRKGRKLRTMKEKGERKLPCCGKLSCCKIEKPLGEVPRA
jgi:hypothetical protein